MDKLYTERTIKTISGIYVDVFEPKPEMFVIEDIAHALSMIPRWGGHYPWFLSVAEHSRAVAYKTKGDKLEALMHDASEAYLMDLPKPIKKNMPEYKAIEDGVMMVIAEKFGFQYPLSEETKLADKVMLEAEWEQKETFFINNLSGHTEPYNYNRQQRKFLDDFHLYSKNRN
ncbi:MAG: hypothetical protein Q8K92_08440 [Leadbetterella sp.]|nr:hypothetical protein [Leadbetterella sp.]